jgi:hypothetical protein
MSDVKKSLTFKFDLDNNSFQKVKTALETLTAQAQRFSEALKGAKVGGGSGGTNHSGTPNTGRIQGVVGGANQGGTSNITQAVMQNMDAFKKLGTEAPLAFRAVTDAVTRAHSQQVGKIRELESEIKKLNSLYGDMSSEIPSGEIASKLGSVVTELKKATQEATKFKNTLDDLSGTRNEGPQVPGGGLPKGARSFMDLNNSPGARFVSHLPGASALGGLGLSPGMVALGGAMGAVGTAAWNGAKAWQATSNGMLEAQGTRGKMTNDLISGIYGGDRSQQVLLRSIAGMGTEDRERFINRYGGGLHDTLQSSAAWAKDMGAALSGGSVLNRQDYLKQTENFKQFQEGVETYGNTAQGGAALRANKYFQDQQGGRLQYNRIFGRGAKIRTGFGGTDTYASKNMDAYSQFLTDKTAEAGYSQAERAAAFTSARAIGGSRFASAFTGSVMSGTAGGYAGMGEAYSAITRSAGNGLRNARDRNLANQQVGQFFGGGVDKNLALQLAPMITRNGFDISGTTSGTGMLAAMQTSGMDLQNSQIVNQMGAAISGGNKAIQGGTGFDQGVRLLSAIKGGGSGASTYLQDHLASGMNIQQLMDAARGNGSDEFKSLGGTTSMAKSQMANIGKSYLLNYKAQGNSGADVAARKAQEILGSGGSMEDFYQQFPSMKKDLAIAMKQGSGGNLQAEEAMNLTNLLGGDVSGALKKGSKPGAGSADDIARKQLQEQNEIMKAQVDEAFKNFTAVFGVDGAVGAKMVEVFGAFGNNLKTSADLASASLFKLAAGGDAALAKQLEDRVGAGTDKFTIQGPSQGTEKIKAWEK